MYEIFFFWKSVCTEKVSYRTCRVFLKHFLDCWAFVCVCACAYVYPDTCTLHLHCQGYEIN